MGLVRDEISNCTPPPSLLPHPLGITSPEFSIQYSIVVQITITVNTVNNPTSTLQEFFFF